MRDFAIDWIAWPSPAEGEPLRAEPLDQDGAEMLLDAGISGENDRLLALYLELLTLVQAVGPGAVKAEGLNGGLLRAGP